MIFKILSDLYKHFFPEKEEKYEPGVFDKIIENLDLVFLAVLCIFGFIAVIRNWLIY